MRIKLILPLLIGLIVFGCSSDQYEMNGIETFVAKKYNVDLASISFKQEETKTNGKITESRKYILIQLYNSPDMDKIMHDADYAEQKGKEVASFVIDSIQFDDMPFNPKELQVDYLSKSGFFIFHKEDKKSITYHWN